MIFSRVLKKRPSRTLSTREILRIQVRVEKETGIRQVGDIKSNRDIYIYHGVLPAAAKDETDRDVFVKVLLSHDQEKRARFERESWICSHFRHDHLIRKEFSRTLSLGGTFKRANMIVLEYIDGIDAAEMLDYLALSGTRLKSALVTEIGIKILKALDEVHSLKDRHAKPMPIVHADVSPQNILLSRKGQVKLIDFGIARVIGDAVHDPPQSRAGKPGYVAPEQVYASEFDHRADLYAAGIVIAELLIGRRLAVANDLADGRRADLSKIYQERICEAKLDPKLRGILLKAIQFEPDKRYATATEFIQSLERYAKSKRMVFHTDGIPGTVAEVMGYFSDLETKQRSSRETQEGVEIETPPVANEKPPCAKPPKTKPKMRLSPLHPYFVGVLSTFMLIGYLKFGYRSIAVKKMQSQSPDLSAKSNESELPQNPVEVAVTVTPSLPPPIKAEPSPATTKPKPQAITKQKEPTGTGTLFVGASPWAEVSIPGYAAQRPIPFTIKLSEGWHKVTARYQAENGKWQYQSKSVRIKRDEKAKCLAFFARANRMTCQ